MSVFTNRVSAPLTSREGLERFYREQFELHQPEPLSPAQFKRMSTKRRAEENERRIRFIHHGLTVGTPVVTEAAKRLSALNVHNRETLLDKLGLGLSGFPYLGKTHILFELARYTANRLYRDVPDFIELEMVPCVIITVPSPTTSKGVLQEMMNFFGFDFNQGYTESKLRSVLIPAMNEHGTRIVAFDEAHNMARGGPTQRESTKNMVRKVVQDVIATPLFAGIQLQQNGLFTGISGSQLSTRTQMLNLVPFSAATEKDRNLFMSTLDLFESGIPLSGNEPGTLRSLAPYLFNRSGGIMGEISNTLRTAAVMLINRGDVVRFGGEQFTEELFEQIPLGAAAQARKEFIDEEAELDWPRWPSE